MGPRRELRHGEQVVAWLKQAAGRVKTPGAELTLVGFGGLLWHALRRDPHHAPPPQLSMDIDPVTGDEGIAEFGYDCVIGSTFELEHGFHVNLMPRRVLDELPSGWKERATRESYENLEVIVPASSDLLAAKMKRGEPRDRMHVEWAHAVGLIDLRTRDKLLAEPERRS